ncbi:hypothetical protein [Bacillus subtilis]|uniref:hypothetical protein n=1 Tax=Bacillus subtilis TaxID=1423 RepID=UPI001C20FFC3|nr:hypothetical protein [Bacillus subtilis]MBU8716582.1 hypothetical protein [Bacillus subtilis]
MKILKGIDQKLKLKINKCIALLGSEYTSLNFNIEPYETREKLEFERINCPDLTDESYEDILNGKRTIGGVTLKDKKRIKIFLYQYPNLHLPKEVLDLVAIFYHELRHAWQIKNNMFQENDAKVISPNENFELYFGDEAEKDAYLFHEEQIRKHTDQIFKIFEFNIPEGTMLYSLNSDIRKRFID